MLSLPAGKTFDSFYISVVFIRNDQEDSRQSVPPLNFLTYVVLFLSVIMAIRQAKTM